jgi:hypothetical protein
MYSTLRLVRKVSVAVRGTRVDRRLYTDLAKSPRSRVEQASESDTCLLAHSLKSTVFCLTEMGLYNLRRRIMKL